MSVEQGPNSFKHPEIGDTQPTPTSPGKFKLNATLTTSILLYQPEVPDELSEEVHFDEDGTIIRPELVGTNIHRQTTVVHPEQDITAQPAIETK